MCPTSLDSKKQGKQTTKYNANKHSSVYCEQLNTMQHKHSRNKVSDSNNGYGYSAEGGAVGGGCSGLE